MSPRALLLAVLALWPAGASRTRVEAAADAIVGVVAAARAQYPRLPSALLVAVGWRETALGLGAGESGGWGAVTARGLPRPALDAARVLDASLTACWGRTTHARQLAALRRFRTGSCERSAVGDAYARRTAALALRIARQRKGVR